MSDSPGVCAACSTRLVQVFVWRTLGAHEVEHRVEWCCGNDRCDRYDIAAPASGSGDPT